jgi:hypothetical protein
MAKNTTAYFLNEQKIQRTTFTSANLTNVQPIFTAAAEDSWIYDIVITSTSPDPRDATIYMHEVSTNTDIVIKQLLSPNNILANQGTGATSANPLRLLQSSDGNQITVRLLDRDQNYFIALPVGWTLRAKMNTAISSGDITFLVMSRNFVA